MKKAIKIVLVVILVAYAMIATMAATEFRSEAEALKAEKPTEVETGVDPMDLLPYKLFYDALVQDLRGNEYDWKKAVDDAAEEYNLSEVEKLTLVKSVEWLTTMVSTLTGG